MSKWRDDANAVAARLAAIRNDLRSAFVTVDAGNRPVSAVAEEAAPIVTAATSDTLPPQKRRRGKGRTAPPGRATDLPE